MLTRTGSRFFLLVVVILATSIWTGTPAVSVLCLTLLLWFLAQWLMFQVRSIAIHGRLRIVREITGDRGPVKSLWAGRAFEVSVRLLNTTNVPLPYVRVHERVPLGLERTSGTADTEGPLAKEAPLVLRYRVQCQAPGQIRFEGLTVQIADLQGFFFRRLFIQDVQILRVRPPLVNTRARLTAEKRHNLLPLIGVHRHRRPGSGGELLDLRDYLPGDPPKMIAWKPSARRDRLMTKEFESEVPIRCTLFVDTSNSVRVGLPGRNALARLIEIVAAVAQANSLTRDPTGLCLCAERVTSYVKPARGPRHSLQLHALLTEAATLAPTTGAASVEALLPMAFGLAEEVYPQLLESDINHFPWWLPLWTPQPPFTVRRPRVPPGTRLRWCKQLWRDAAIGFRQHIIARLLPRYWKRYRWRKQVAALVSALYRLGPGALALLLEDDRRFVLQMQRFLNDHHVPFELPLYGPRQQYLFAAPEKVPALAGALRQAVGRGRDNELFVVLADLLEIADRLDPLLAAVKMAVARHHAVMVVCPWPPGVPQPDRSPREAGQSEGQYQAALAKLVRGNRAPEVLALILQHTTILRLHRAYEEIRHTFARLRVPVCCARHDESVGLILSRLEQLRALERGVR